MTASSDPIDVEFARSYFPGLAAGWAPMDNAGGSQATRGAIERIAEFLIHRNVQIGGGYAVSRAAAEGLAMGREAARTNACDARPVAAGARGRQPGGRTSAKARATSPARAIHTASRGRAMWASAARRRRSRKGWPTM